MDTLRIFLNLQSQSGFRNQVQYDIGKATQGAYEMILKKSLRVI